jgi:hypothetical protein
LDVMKLVGSAQAQRAETRQPRPKAWVNVRHNGQSPERAQQAATSSVPPLWGYALSHARHPGLRPGLSSLAPSGPMNRVTLRPTDSFTTSEQCALFWARRAQFFAPRDCTRSASRGCGNPGSASAVPRDCSRSLDKYVDPTDRADRGGRTPTYDHRTDHSMSDVRCYTPLGRQRGVAALARVRGLCSKSPRSGERGYARMSHSQPREA